MKPEKLYLVEYSEDFVRHLAAQFPGVNIIEGDAFDLDRTLGDRRGMVFDSVVSGVPLLNFPVPQRVRYIEDLLDRIPPGRPIMQLTYGPKSPVPAGLGDYTGRALRLRHPQHSADAALGLSPPGSRLISPRRRFDFARP